MVGGEKEHRSHTKYGCVPRGRPQTDRGPSPSISAYYLLSWVVCIAAWSGRGWEPAETQRLSDMCITCAQGGGRGACPNLRDTCVQVRGLWLCLLEPGPHGIPGTWETTAEFVLRAWLAQMACSSTSPHGWGPISNWGQHASTAKTTWRCQLGQRAEAGQSQAPPRKRSRLSKS